MSEPSLPDTALRGDNRRSNPWMGTTLALGSLLLLGVGALGGWLYAHKMRSDVSGTVNGASGTDASQAGDAWALHLVNDISIKSQQLAILGNAVLAGDKDAFAKFKEARSSVEASLHLLQAGNGTYPGFHGDATEGAQVQKLADAWKPIASNADVVIGNEEQILAFAQSADKFSADAMPLKARQDEVARAMSDHGAAAAQILWAMRQISLIDTIERDIVVLRSGGTEGDAAAEQVHHAFPLYTQVFKGFRDGDSGIGIIKLEDPAEVAALGQVGSLIDGVEPSLDVVLKNAKQVAEAAGAAKQIAIDSTALITASQALYLSINPTTNNSGLAIGDQRIPSNTLASVAPATPSGNSSQAPQQQSSLGPYGMTEAQIRDCEKYTGNYHAKLMMAESLARFKGKETVTQELIESMQKEGASEDCIAYLNDQESK